MPAFTPLASQGLVDVVRNTPQLMASNGFFVEPTSDICATLALTPAGIATLQANALDKDPTNDAISVGIASYLLTADSSVLSKQQLLDSASTQLTLVHTSETLCVAAEDVLCTQVDAYTGDQPFNFTNGFLPADQARFLRGAIFDQGQLETIDSSTLPSGHCPPDTRGNQGLTLGYWKNHLNSWQVYSPTQKLGAIYSSLTEDLDPITPGVQNPYSALANKTCLEALNFDGGPTTTDAIKLLLKQSVAALLNAANSGVHYPMTTGQIKVAVNNAIESGNRTTILNLQSQLDANNSLEGVSLDGANTTGNGKKK